MQLIHCTWWRLKKKNPMNSYYKCNLICFGFFWLLVFSFIVFQIIIATTLDGALFFMIYNFYENILWSLLTTVLDGIYKNKLFRTMRTISVYMYWFNVSSNKVYGIAFEESFQKYESINLDITLSVYNNHRMKLCYSVIWM